MSSAPSKKTVKKSTPAAAVSAPVSVSVTDAPVSVPAPVASSSSAPAQKRVGKKASASSASASSPSASSVTEPVASSTESVAASTEPAASPAAAASATEVVETSWNDDLTGLTKHLSTMRDTISTLFTEVKRLEKKVARTVKDAGKRRKNRKVEAGASDVPRRPTAFEIPQNVSEDLNVFLGQPKGTQISRANVTKRVTAYAKEHSLMNKHAINADATLLKLLNPSANLAEGETLTIFTLQKCLRNHYIKAVPAPVATATA